MTVPTPLAWRPTLEDVHALLARREAFTETSRPSRLEVESLVSRIVSEVAVEVEGDLPPRLHELARTAVAYGAASLVEQSFTPEQSLGDDAPAAALYARYVALLGRLRAHLGELGVAAVTGGDTGAGGDGPRRYRLGTVGTPTALELELRARSTDTYLLL